MAPSQHIDWLVENTDWFLELPASSLTSEIPACPGWTLENVVTHLAYGLGLGYPHALRAAPDSTAAEAFANVPWPTDMPVGPAVFTEFERTMRECIETFRHTDPGTPCFTYQGPGAAAFWFRRAAIETTLHRMDAVEGLGLSEPQLADERAGDAVAETVEFALPYAAQMSETSASAVAIRVAGSSTEFQLGFGPVAAEIAGDATSLLAALWGRSKDGVEINGDPGAASAWMSMVERAFAGR